eukprot:Platyproteum_vivax@DN7297_c1_g1_i4.p1
MIRYILVIVGVLGCLAVRDRHGLSTANYKFPQTGIRTLRIRTGLKETPELLIDNLSDADLNFLKTELPTSEFNSVYIVERKKKGRNIEYKKDDVWKSEVLRYATESIEKNQIKIKILEAQKKTGDNKREVEGHLKTLKAILEDYEADMQTWEKEITKKGRLIFEKFKSPTFANDVGAVPERTNTYYLDCLTPNGKQGQSSG